MPSSREESLSNVPSLSAGSQMLSSKSKLDLWNVKLKELSSEEVIGLSSKTSMLTTSISGKAELPSDETSRSTGRHSLPSESESHFRKTQPRKLSSVDADWLSSLSFSMLLSSSNPISFSSTSLFIMSLITKKPFVLLSYPGGPTFRLHLTMCSWKGRSSGCIFCKPSNTCLYVSKNAGDSTISNFSFSWIT